MSAMIAFTFGEKKKINLKKEKQKNCYLSVVTVQSSIRYHFVQLDAI